MLNSRLKQGLRQIGGTDHFVAGGKQGLGTNIATLVVAGFMVSVALRMAGPTVHPDEFGFLTNGQVLIGHQEALVPTGSFYPAGYGIVTGLGALVTGSISGAYRFSLLTNLFLAALTAWCACRMAKTEFGSSQGMARLIGALVFVVPGSVVSSLFSWSENAARLGFLLFVWGVMYVTRRRSTVGCLSLGLFVGVLPALHGRFTLLIPIICLVFAWWSVTHLISKFQAIVAVTVTAMGYYLSYLLNTYVKSAVYLSSYDQENRLLVRLFKPSVWPALLRTMVGQSWYLAATSVGLVGIAVAFSVVRILQEGGPKTLPNDSQRLGLFVLVAGTLMVIFTGGLQLLYGNRGDHLIYGRYVEMLVPALLVVAGVALEKSTRMARSAWFLTGIGAMVIALLYVAVDGGDGVKGGYVRGNVVFPNIIGTDFARYVVQPGLLSFGGLFAVLTIIFWWLSRKFGAWSLSLLVVLMGFGSMYSGDRSILSRTKDLEAVQETIDIVESSGASRIAFDAGVRNDRAYYYLRYKLHPVKLELFDISSPDATIPQSYSCAYGFIGKPPSDGQWQEIAVESVLERVLWRRAGRSGC